MASNDFLSVATIDENYDNDIMNGRDKSCVRVTYTTLEPTIVLTEDSLRAIFSQFGEILKVDAVTSPIIRINDACYRCYGFVFYANTQDGFASAQNAVENLRSVLVNGVHLICSLCGYFATTNGQQVEIIDFQQPHSSYHQGLMQQQQVTSQQLQLQQGMSQGYGLNLPVSSHPTDWYSNYTQQVRMHQSVLQVAAQQAMLQQQQQQQQHQQVLRVQQQQMDALRAHQQQQQLQEQQELIFAQRQQVAMQAAYAVAANLYPPQVPLQTPSTHYTVGVRPVSGNLTGLVAAGTTSSYPVFAPIPVAHPPLHPAPFHPAFNSSPLCVTFSPAAHDQSALPHHVVKTSSPRGSFNGHEPRLSAESGQSTPSTASSPSSSGSQSSSPRNKAFNGVEAPLFPNRRYRSSK